ncbi:MAG: hypothetical protein ACRC9Y_15415 [Aeromonas veronii]
MSEKLVAAAMEENPIAFKHEFEAQMKSRIDSRIAQARIDVAQSIRVDGEEDTSEE